MRQFFRQLHPAFCALFVAAATSLTADTITLTNGRVIEGRVISQDERRVTIEVRGMVTQIAASSVRSIARSQDWENTYRDIEAALRRRDAIRGLDLTFRAAQEGAPTERLAALIERHNSGIAGAIFASSPAQKTTLRVQLRQLVSSPELLTDRALFLTAQNFHALDDWNSAAELIAQVPEPLIDADPEARSWALGFLRQLVRRLVNRGEMQGALVYIEEMWRLSEGETTPEITLATLYRASNAREEGNFAESFRIIAEELHPLAPEIARNRIAAVRDALFEETERRGGYDGALRALEPLARHFPLEYRATRRGLAAREARRAYEIGNYGRVSELVSELQGEDLSDELRRLALLAEHEIRMAALPEGEPLPLFQHGRWCEENGLLDEAIIIYNQTRETPALRELSDEAIRLARRQRDTILLEQANAAYRDGRIDEAMPRVELIISRQDVGSALMLEATKLKDLMQRSIARDREEAPYRAEVLFQEAERAYFVGNLVGAFNQLNSVIENYPETPAGKRSATLLGDVVRGLEIAYLEGKMPTLPTVPERFNSDVLERSDVLGQEVNALLDALVSERR